VVLARIDREDDVARLTEQQLLSASARRSRGRGGFGSQPRSGFRYSLTTSRRGHPLQEREAALKKVKERTSPISSTPHQLTERIADGFPWRTSCRQALERQEFVLHYQPKVRTKPGA